VNTSKLAELIFVAWKKIAREAVDSCLENATLQMHLTAQRMPS
jgi:hypothetical protein